MHPSPAFAESDPARIAGIIRNNPFGILVTAGPGGFAATHIPFDLVQAGENWVVEGHLSAANAQCAALDGAAAMAVFSGPHAYVSPSWYAAGPAVPTWNYLAVTLHGVLAPVADPTPMLARLASLDPGGFAVAALDDAYRRRMFAGIRAFRLTAQRVEAVWKMNQNKSAADRQGVIAGLQRTGNWRESEVAALMEADEPARHGDARR